MAEVPPEITGLLNYASNIFALDPQLLIFPNVIGSVIIPMILNTLMIKIMAQKLHAPNIIAWLIGGVSAYMTLPWGSVIMYAAVVVIGATRSWGIFLRILFIAAVGAGLFIGLPILYDLFAKGFFVRV